MIEIAVAAALGALTWTLLEYCIHRWLGHDRRLRPNFFAAEHLPHHSRGNYFAPASKKIGAAAAATVALGVPAWLLVGLDLGLAYTAGLIGFYVFYEVLHRREHTHPGRGGYGRWARRHHFFHHFHDPSMNHGVTSPIWDLVFGTYRSPGRVRVPQKLAMRWLLDDQGAVWPQHQAHFELRQ